ncbi:Acetylxylan esterase [Fulvia fulva]|uniref:Acetylxylan esterase n=1 Tax=Passalora fulva TaxID=5499 RepID=A0A9Q8LAD0_PASFU|nr:Acetylxylan esterase [Fulvia fulva]KAK4631028.1 Acetylxylan esterase [Fulvia fulva]KAK4633650.1 Acetylxylan esterase [Fulvia fulva]UJO13722.1 Acetylxylan esterase [Fulvia fulva]WPV11185.1 Acetylxylan esterase [Fulvia fulva]WPV25817.1 Acetylxylan esterase [Fulvia fulva]
MLRSLLLLSLGLLSTAQFTNNPISNATSSDCPTENGAHIIVARASVEALGYGIIGQVKDNVLKQVPGSTAEFVVYPATLNDYFNSETDGVVGMRKLIDAYVAKCANAPLVLMGYSQGAQVTADSLVGQQVAAFPPNSTVSQPLPDSTLERVAAAVIMGDPTSNLTESFHVGNATKNGIFPRKNVANFEATGLASRMKSYCDEGDPYCASGKFSEISVHLRYVQEYGAEATQFVVDQIKAYYENGTTTASNGTSTGAPAATYTGSASSARYSSVAGVVALGAVVAYLL